MISPRTTRLLRVPSLRALQDALAAIVAGLDGADAAATFIVVPTRAAGEQLRRTVEDRLLDRQPVVFWPVVGTRTDLYRELAMRSRGGAGVLSALDREVLFGRIAREVAAAGIHPPFTVRAALIAEMVALYDFIHRQGRTVEDFERNLRVELEPAQDTDRGAAQLLRQTAFLSEVFRRYELHLSHHALRDEHRLRAHVVAEEPARPLGHVLVAVGDRIADADGLWPVDFTLLSTIPGLARLDVLTTEALLATGLLERIHAALPGLEEQRGPRTAAGGETGALPRLFSSAPDQLVATSRDREDELAAVARRIKSARRRGDRTPLARQALIVRRPLPYLYLARSVFGGAGVPFETLDTLPLAAEPYAAALDLVLDAPISGFSRASLIALLRSPHFDFRGLAPDATPAAVGALDRSLAEARYLGGAERLERLETVWSGADTDRTREARRRVQAIPALRLGLTLARELAPLGEPRPMLAQLATISGFLERYGRPRPEGPESERVERVRLAVAGALASLTRAFAAHDADAEATGTELSSTIRRWLGAQTFALRTGAPGIRLLDAQAARFADVDDVQLLGLVEGEWPEPARRSIFYPPFLLGLLEPAPAAEDPNRRESEMMAAARASFLDLLLLARSRVRVSSFALEADAVVEPSPFVDDLGAIGLALEIDAESGPAHVFADEALLSPSRPVPFLPALAQAWAEVRSDAPWSSERRYLGEAGSWRLPRISVSRVDRYLKCPFQFFASEVLKLEEEPEDGDLPPPWERGRFLHAIFESFFREWQRRGRTLIGASDLGEARALLIEVSERALSALPAQEAALERPRLYGSAVSAGIIDRVLSMEAERPAPVQHRLVEYALDAEFAFRDGEGGSRLVPLRAKIDRVDLLEGGQFRVIDYKSKLLPDPKRSVQLQIYTAAVAQQLERGGDVREPSEAFYLSLEGDAAARSLRPAKGQSFDEVLREAEGRMIQALDDIGAGHFPPRPVPRSLCNQCPFDAVCRRAFVEAADD